MGKSIIFRPDSLSLKPSSFFTGHCDCIFIYEMKVTPTLEGCCEGLNKNIIFTTCPGKGAQNIKSY